MSKAAQRKRSAYNLGRHDAMTYGRQRYKRHPNLGAYRAWFLSVHKLNRGTTGRPIGDVVSDYARRPGGRSLLAKAKAAMRRLPIAKTLAR